MRQFRLRGLTGVGIEWSLSTTAAFPLQYWLAPVFTQTHQAALGYFSVCVRHVALLLCFAVIAPAEPADWIYSARYVVTMDAQHGLIDDGAVAIRGERIIGVGKRADISRQFQPTHRLDRPEAILMPGLINTHTHAAMSLLRGIADDLR